MADVTIEDIEKAEKLMKKNGKVPNKIRMSPKMKAEVFKMLHEKGIETRASNGRDYILGLEVIIDNRLQGNLAYIE